MKNIWVPALVSSLVLISFLGARSARGDSPLAQNGGRIRVVTKKFEPFVIKDGAQWTGFSIDLWNALARELNLQSDWIEVDTVSQQLQAVANGDADAAIAGISMTPERERMIDFSFPYFTAGLQIMTAPRGGELLPNLFGFLASPALVQIFLIASLLALGMAHLIWWVERNGDAGIRKAYLPGVWDGFWWLLNIVANGEYGDKNTRSFIKRLITIGFWLLGVIFIAEFTATVTSSLTVKQLSGSIAGPADLPGKRVAVVRGTTGAQYLADHFIPAVQVTQITDAYALLEQRQVDAIVYDAPVLQYYTTKEGKGKVQVVGPIFKEETYGIALPTGSRYRKPINEALLKLKQDGTYDELYAKWFGNK